MALAAGLALALAGCQSSGSGDTAYPEKTAKDTYSPTTASQPRDSVFGPSGINIFGTGKKAPEEGGGGIGVNSFLWRASLDTISFMPLASADPFGGVIITDWYSLPDKPDERIKLTVFVVDRELRSDAIRVTVHVQTRTGTDGNWSTSFRDEEFSRRLENLILNRAREIRAESLTDFAE